MDFNLIMNIDTDQLKEVVRDSLKKNVKVKNPVTNC